MKNKYYKLAATLLSTSLLFACTNQPDSEKNEEESIPVARVESTIGNQEVSTIISELVTYEKDDLYSDWKSANPTYIQLNGSTAEFDTGSSILFDENTLTIKTGGVYVLSGQFDDGQIVIDAEDKSTVRLVLNGVEINSSTSSAIFVSKAEKTVISLEEGTENVISDGDEYVLEDSSSDEPNAAIFSKDDLTINGTGTLIVHGNYNNGITSKDKLKITSGDIQIDAVDDGLMGRDIVAVKEGAITIDSGGDGIKSSNDKDASKGNIALEGGTYQITAASDGIQAEASLYIANGDYTISSGGGSPESIVSNTNEKGGRFGNETTSTTTTGTETESTKGLKAAVEVAIADGTFNIDSLDDGIHSNSSVTIVGGEMTIATGDDGIHADASILTEGGDITIAKSYEGMESKVIAINEGNIHVTSSDDGINIGGGKDGSGMDMQSSNSEDNLLSINGGNVYVDAQGDGLDSNGSISMTGGTVLVNGPTGSGNGALDYDSSFEISGGILIAAGSSGMAQAASEQSTQSSILMTYSDIQSAGTAVHLGDDKGNSILTVVPIKDYQSIFISSPKLTKDTAYTLYSGGTSTGEEMDGLYVDGSYKGGTKIVEFTMTESVIWLNESGVTTGSSSGPGGMNPGGGQARPERNQDGTLSNLDEETQEKVQAIMQQQREGTITIEEAQTQLAELGVEMPVKGKMQ